MTIRWNINFWAYLIFLFIPTAWADIHSPLVGVWKMTSLETLSEGKFHSVPYSGQLIITESGTLSAQAMDADQNAKPTPYTLNGYEALYGTIIIDESSKTFETTVQSALVRNLIGQKMKRSFKISGNKMTLMPVNTAEGWRVNYERY